MYQLLSSYFNSAVNFLNQKLQGAKKFLKSNLALKTECLPTSLDTPVNFCGLFSLFLFIIIVYLSNFICRIFAILYPLSYYISTFKRQTYTNYAGVTSIKKYFVLYSAIELMEWIFGFLVYFIPGYLYLKIFLLYGLMRNDFALSNIVFSILQKKYSELSFKLYIDKLFGVSNAKIKSDLKELTK